MVDPAGTLGRRAACAALFLTCVYGAALGGEIEVIHYWDSGAEAKAAAYLKSALKAKGHSWKDFVVAGGGSGQAVNLLESRVASGNPPSAAQIKRPVVQYWARAGLLANMDDLAKIEHWDDLLPKVASDAVKFNGSYVAVPINIHRLNWLWINSKLLRRAGTPAPVSWEDFFVTAEAMKRAGFIAVAHGGQPSQTLHMFESVVLGIGGPEFYRQAFVALDPVALTGPVMERSLLTLRRIKPYTDRNAHGRDWNLTANSLVRGEAGMQFIGDWVKPQFSAAHQASGFDFLCVPAPGTSNAFSFVIDSFALFKVSGPAKIHAQNDLAAALLSPQVQQEFNLRKGSIPVRLGINLDRFDTCAKASSTAFTAASHDDTLVPSLGMALPSPVEEAMWQVIGDFWDDDRLTPKTTMARLLDAARRR
jgi:glucose/mannose transport system substrate-binding protein